MQWTPDWASTRTLRADVDEYVHVYADALADASTNASDAPADATDARDDASILSTNATYASWWFYSECETQIMAGCLYPREQKR